MLRSITELETLAWWGRRWRRADGGAGGGTEDEEAGHSGRRAEVAKVVGGSNGVEEVGSDGEGDAVGVVVAIMTTMTAEMLATRAMVTMMATMT